ncbi:MAG: hypothetical protein Q8936_08385 [Bacillota bacterium]|nr:hypothetical protein [Bacillota bacterium]
MNINETTSMNASITLKDNNGSDTVVATLNANLDAGTANLNIYVNVTNKSLMTVTATNTAGETAQVQYSQFESAVKNRAKESGYVIFA